VLAAIVDFETKQATIGTQAGSVVSTSEVLAALESIGYQGQLVEHRPVNDATELESPKSVGNGQ
jgi:hypothetical protein